MATGKQLKSVLRFVAVKLAAAAKKGSSCLGGDAVCQGCYGCSLYCEFLLTLFYVLKIVYNNIHLNFAVVNTVSHKRSSNVSLVLTPHFFSVLSCI